MGLHLKDMNSMVGIALAIKREMEDAQGIRDASVGGKRKEDQPSSSLETRQRTFVPRVPQVQGQSGPMTCFYCHQLGHMKRDCESEISGILLMVDLRVVDIAGFDVVLDKDELTTHRVVNDCDLRQVIIPDTSLELCRVAYACE